MKKWVLVAWILALANCGLAQTIQSQYSARVEAVVQRLRSNKYALPTFHVGLVDSREINAFADAETHQITVTNGLVYFTRTDPGELAFAIAHELGHLEEGPCERDGRISAASIAADRRKSQQCEAKADEIGMLYMVGANYSPYDAAAFLGRMIMFQGDTGFRGIVLRFESDHPVNIQRIENLRKLLDALCARAGVKCTE